MGCVYKIENKVTGMFYIGSTNNFNRRKWEHFGELKRHEHYSKSMQEDYDKYGADSFVMSVLEECDDEVRRDREQYYIDLYDAANKGYNFSDSAYFNKAGFCNMDKHGENNPFYGKHHSEETKKRLRETWDRTREQRSGFTRSEETKQKIRDTKMGEKNPNATHILQYSLDGKLVNEWNCIKEAADYYGMKSKSSISNCCKANAISDTDHVAKGYIWKYAGTMKEKAV